MPLPSRLSDDEAKSLVKLVQFKVSRFLGTHPKNHSPDPDLVQDVFVRVLERLPKYDPLRGCLTTFVARITETTLIDLARRANAAKRNPGKNTRDHRTSGQSWFTSPDEVEAEAPDDHERRRDLELDLIEAIQRLAPELQRTAEELRHSSVQEVAEREGVHKGTIYRRMKEIRQRWDDGTLRDYLDP